MFTLEIEGKAVAVINGDEETARDLFTCDGFKEDIQKMTSDGAPLWNGTSELKIRAASEDEIEIFEDALAEDDGEGDFEDDPRHAAANDATTDESEDDETDESEDDEDEADIVFLLDIDEADALDS